VQINPSPVVLLNRCIVISKIDGFQKAIESIYSIPEIDKHLESKYLFPAVLGELYRHSNKKDEAKKFLERAIGLTHSPLEKKLLQKKLSMLP
jgi:RNA polymerase sigma-70 factor (ECF subfamily)